MKTIMARYTLVFTLLIAMIGACSESGTGPEEEQKEPGKPVGILPVNAETCSDFKEVTGADDKAAISFSWSITENAVSYLVQIFESEIEVKSIPLTATQTEFILEKGKSYTWIVTAENSAGKTQSNTMSFTTPGQPQGNFAPYAAEIKTEFNNTTSELSISWIGSDEDGDTLTYDINVKDGEGIEIVDQTGMNETILDPIIVSSGKVYTIKVRSMDSHGNFSISTSTVEIPG